MARPIGRRNFIPGEGERRDYVRRLRERADAGDTDAAGWLLLAGMLGSALRTNQPKRPVQAVQFLPAKRSVS